MSAPGIQLDSEPHLTHFQPTIRQYLQRIKEAVMSNNLPAAQQAFAQLRKSIPFPAQGSGGQRNELATRMNEGVQALGRALEAGELSAVAYFFARTLQQDINVPIGLIQDCLGGTPAETWTSADALRPLKDFEVAMEETRRLQKRSDRDEGLNAQIEVNVAEARRVRAEREDAERRAKVERGRQRDALARVDDGESVLEEAAATGAAAANPLIVSGAST